MISLQTALEVGLVVKDSVLPIWFIPNLPSKPGYLTCDACQIATPPQGTLKQISPLPPRFDSPNSPQGYACLLRKILLPLNTCLH